MSHISAKCNRVNSATSIPDQFLVEITSSDGFVAKDQGLDVRGRISGEHAQMLYAVLEETSLRLEVSCTMNIEGPSKAVDRVFFQRPCLLNMTMFGPLLLFDKIGSFFEEYEVYLQDPLQLGEHDGRYCNPHRLSSSDLASCPLLSEFLAQSSHITRFEAVSQQPDLLDILSSHTELDEHPQPQAIGTSLKRCLHNSESLEVFRTDDQYL